MGTHAYNAKYRLVSKPGRPLSCISIGGEILMQYNRARNSVMIQTDERVEQKDGKNVYIKQAPWHFIWR